MSARYKAIVIGSGAGGAPAAATLAAAWGEGVALLEAGPLQTAADLNQREADMVPRLYAQGGAQATEDGSFALLQGTAVGGSTLINDGLCFRPPPELVERWQRYGVDLAQEPLDAYVDEVEAAMRVEQIPRAMINRANYLVALGAARLGWRVERLRHNSPGCVECGFRHLGCAYDRKQGMNLTFVPRAQIAGATLLPGTRAEALTRREGRWQVQTSAGALEAEHVVLAAGVVQTPALLLRSGIPAGEGLQMHVSTLAWGDFEEPVDGFNGIPMAVGVLEFADVLGQSGPGFLIEGVSVQPMAFSAQVQAQGALFSEAVSRYRHMAGALSLIRSSARGRISLGPGGRAKIDYPLVEADRARVAQFYDRAFELLRSAGARRVLLAHRQTGWLSAPPQDLELAPGRQYLYAAHPFGGANRGAVTDAAGRVRGQPNLWVLDGSAVPEALGVNPMVTIAALSLQGARRLLSEAGA